MLLEAVEGRFGGLQAPQRIEFLADNGFHPTRLWKHAALPTQLGLLPCFMPVASPQSDGVSESFVRTLKRDYVRVKLLPSVANALGQIAGWFEGYNENHPHSGRRIGVSKGVPKISIPSRGIRLNGSNISCQGRTEVGIVLPNQRQGIVALGGMVVVRWPAAGLMTDRRHAILTKSLEQPVNLPATQPQHQCSTACRHSPRDDLA